MYNDPIVIIGAGPSGLIAAQYLAERGYAVQIYDHNKAAARKFLVAGHGGFNLTHSEDIESFILRYDKEELHKIIRNFDNQQTIAWLASLGIQTYKGSSGKIFPIKEVKPIQVLNTWLNRLTSLHVQIHYQHGLVDFDDTQVTVSHGSTLKNIKFSKLILALGGGSWRKTGSNAQWIDLFTRKNIIIIPLSAANSGFNTAENFGSLEGQILKNINVKFNDIQKKGELVFTTYGIEGSPIYYLNRFIRNHIFPIDLHIDLKPSLSETFIAAELAKNKNFTKTLKEKLKLSTTAINLLKRLPKEEFISPTLLSQQIKSYPIQATSLRPIEEVISTAGGVCFRELNDTLNLVKYPNVYCIGEMVDWEAPTGGYLLQACFSMGIYAAQDICAKDKIKDQ